MKVKQPRFDIKDKVAYKFLVNELNVNPFYETREGVVQGAQIVIIGPKKQITRYVMLHTGDLIDETNIIKKLKPKKGTKNVK